MNLRPFLARVLATGVRRHKPLATVVMRGLSLAVGVALVAAVSASATVTAIPVASTTSSGYRPKRRALSQFGSNRSRNVLCRSALGSVCVTVRHGICPGENGVRVGRWIHPLVYLRLRRGGAAVLGVAD
jgi:hypothetical protein